ncbi:MAG: MATE family efflux transporter [Lachnospiraceae bacterium]|nr:MATE family efflux transporter [Lachnospiraceae bacterium]
MTEGKPIALIIAFAIPLMLGNVFQQLYSVVDSMVVGKFLGVDALAALGATTWPNWVILGFLQGLTQGFSIVMSQAFGAQDGKKLRRAVGNSAVLSALSAVVLFLFGQIFARAMLGLLSTPEEIVPYAMVYLRISFLGIPVITGYNLFAAILRALGDGQTPLRAMAVASIVNVLLDLLFVTVFGWGIAGAAIATVTAQLCSCILCFNRVRKIEILALARSDFRLDGRLSKGMFILSMPMALQNLLIAGGGMIVQSVVNRYGMVFIAGFTAGSKLHGVLEIATSSYGFAMTTYVGQNLGAGRMDRIHKGVRSALVAAVATSAVIAGTMLLSGRLILSGFVSGTEQEIAETISVAYRYLTIMCVCLPVLYVLYIIRSSLQGMGNTVWPMISGIGELIMRTSAALLLPAVVGETGVFLEEVLAWFGADVILISSYLVTVRKTEEKLKRQRVDI